MKDLKEYLSVTTKKVTIEDFDDDFLYFINWFYQKNKKQGLGSKYIANIDRIMELLDCGFHDQHWDDYHSEMGYETEHTSVLSEILSDCNIKVNEFFVNSFEPIEESVNSDLSDDDFSALDELGLITVAHIHDDMMKIYCEIFEKRDIDYMVIDDEIYIGDYSWGHDFIFSISNKDINIGDLETLWLDNDGMCNILSGDEFTYFLYSEDMEGYNESFNLSQFFADLYKSDLIRFDETDILQMTFADSNKSAKLSRFFNDTLKSIECTKEVVF